MQRVIVIVSGDVQRVGYRDAVEAIARKLRLTGYVENFKPYDVRIVAEGEKIAEFMKKIEIKKEPILVEEIAVKYEEPTGEFKYFEIRRDSWQEEMGERMDAAGKLLYQNVELSRHSVELTKESVELGKESVGIGKTMLEKQDKTIDILGDVRTDLGTAIERYGEISATMKEIQEDVRPIGRLADAVDRLVNYLTEKDKR